MNQQAHPVHVATQALPERSDQLSANVYEPAGGEEYIVEIPVAGVRPDEIVIEATVSTITVRIEPRQQQDDSGRSYLKREHSLQPMSRVFEFPMDIDTDNVRGTLENGILRIRARKAIAARRRLIRVEQQ
jgi:HSP20 family molecular chaperone IbpA